DRKKSILKSASYSFETFGYKATTMEQVAKLAKVSKGTIYNFFKNKDELFFEVTKELLMEMKITAEKVIEPEASFGENTHRILFALLELRNTSSLMIKLIHEANYFKTPSVIQVMDELDNMIITIVKEKLQLAIDRKKIKPCDTEITSFVIIHFYYSLLFDWQQ